MNNAEQQYQQQSQLTAGSLRAVTTSPQLRQLSRLSLPEIEHLTDEVARVVPAGNVPGVILNGLARLEKREVAPDESRKHVGLLFKGVQQALDRVVYGAFFAGPAAVLYGYQQLLRLAGKDPDSAFPDGTWQFYLEFALREDSARHANETTGFQTRLKAHGIALRSEDALAAWLLASVYFLRMLPDVLANEWRERTACRLLHEFGGPDIYPDWERKRPFQRGADAQQEDFATYRRRTFDAFFTPYYNNLSRDYQQTYRVRFDAAQLRDLPAFQRQMSWLAYLEPGQFNETRVPYSWDEAFIGVIRNGRYFLLPVNSLLDPEAARTLAAALDRAPATTPAALDDALVRVRRTEQVALRKTLDGGTGGELEILRRAPILVNWDTRDTRLPLTLIRQGKRGVGDHALTLFFTPESTVFDQSHVFFDGAWGSAAAEMMTNDALSWAQYLARLPALKPGRVPDSLKLPAKAGLLQKAAALTIGAETGAENTRADLNAVFQLRKMLKQRNDLAQVTVNDLLLLYRGLHAQSYQPSQALTGDLAALATDKRPEAQQAHRLIQESFAALRGKNPALLIPIDASRHDPRERVFPTTFRNPLTDFYTHHRKTLDALQAYRGAGGKRDKEFKAFLEAQRYYLSLLHAFGELLTRYRQVALSGQSFSTANIRFLANVPPVLQKLLDAIPGKFDVLNEIIKGEEVFSNMGRVVKGSSLRRFTTAKDDNTQKVLAWGVMTDDRGTMHLSLRDFRPHVTLLQKLGMDALAQRIAQDYLDAYAGGLNAYVAELYEITLASRETLPER